MADSFNLIAPYYDQLMKPVPYSEWVEYYQLLLAVLDNYPKTVLDIGCGTGAMCELLTAEGFEMTGIDLSPEMIEQAKRKRDASELVIDYHVADASDFELDKTFEGALSFFDSLNNILEPERLASAFHSIFRAIKPGGCLIFDMNTAYAFQEEMFTQRNLSKKSDLTYDWVGSFDEATRIIEVQMKFWFQDREFSEVHRQRAYEIEEIREMLLAADFTGLRAFHSYTLDRPRRTSDRIHYCALRP